MMDFALKRNTLGHLCRCPGSGALAICSAAGPCDCAYTGDVQVYCVSGDFGFGRRLHGGPNWHDSWNYTRFNDSWDVDVTGTKVGDCEWVWSVTIAATKNGVALGSITYHSAAPGCWEVDGYLISHGTPPPTFVQEAEFATWKPGR